MRNPGQAGTIRRMQGALTHRTATPDDVEALCAFWATAGENAGRPEDRPDLVRRLVVHDADAVLIAELDGEIVGTLVAGWDGWRASLYRLAVSPAHRRRGLAGNLLARADERFRRLGAERVNAMVLDGNESGRALWEAAGFTRQEDWSRWVKRLSRVNEYRR